MIPETENPKEAKSVFPGKPARHDYADPDQYITQRPFCWFSHGTAHLTFRWRHAERMLLHLINQSTESSDGLGVFYEAHDLF